jgi:cystathionine beta-lyase/cystathionine gamma-synthase
MVLTGEQSKNAFKHLTAVVFGLTPTNPLMQALAIHQIASIEELLLLFPSQIEALSVVDATTGMATPVPMSHRNLIHTFRQYLIHLEKIGNPIGDNWTSIYQRGI